MILWFFVFNEEGEMLKLSSIILSIMLIACTETAPADDYEIDSWGTNFDFSEFTPKGNTDYFCVTNGSSLFCMPKS